MSGPQAKGGSGKGQDAVYYNDPAKWGYYQYISLGEIVNNFIAAYVGENKVFENVNDGDISYHAHRALQELSYDTLKSINSQEITLPPSLQMTLPNNYVNYTKITYSDANGIEHIIYPTSKTSNPNTIQQDADGNYLFSADVDGKNNQLVEDHSLKRSSDAKKIVAQGYMLTLDDEYGFELSNGKWKMKEEYSGPFKLAKSFKKANSPLYPNMSSSLKNTDTDPYFKNGMEVDNWYFEPGTTMTSVSTVENPYHAGSYQTIFYISKPTGFNATTFPPGGSAGPAEHQYYVTIDDMDGTWGKYKNSSNNSIGVDSSATTNLSVDADNYFLNTGQRYGLEPQHAQANGSFFIDEYKGVIHFSSNLSGKTIILHYLSDGHAEGVNDWIIHKFAEEAMYKWIAYGCAHARTDIPEPIIQRFKREKSVETRKAKLRLSNIKIEEISQIMRGKSKFIDH
tara:strand:+ start:41 stop:1399 length:1359 start_codon:yes stop_codon:yes gene_type:complete